MNQNIYKFNAFKNKQHLSNYKHWTAKTTTPNMGTIFAEFEVIQI